MDEVVVKKPKKKKLKMTRKNVYSRAYHRELCKTGQKLLAQKKGQDAVEEWEKTLH